MEQLELKSLRTSEKSRTFARRSTDRPTCVINRSPRWFWGTRARKFGAWCKWNSCIKCPSMLVWRSQSSTSRMESTSCFSVTALTNKSMYLTCTLWKNKTRLNPRKTRPFDAHFRWEILCHNKLKSTSSLGAPTATCSDLTPSTTSWRCKSNSRSTSSACCSSTTTHCSVASLAATLTWSGFLTEKFFSARIYNNSVAISFRWLRRKIGSMKSSLQLKRVSSS